MQYLEEMEIINKCEVNKNNKISIRYGKSRIIEQDDDYNEINQ